MKVKWAVEAKKNVGSKNLTVIQMSPSTTKAAEKSTKLVKKVVTGNK